MGSALAGISRNAARIAAIGVAIVISGAATPAAAQTEAAASTITVTGVLRPTVPNLFGTVAVPARVSRYAEGWYRARQDASSHPAMQRLIAPARGLSKDMQIAYVQSAVTRQIHWVSDATEWGKHDYWATAAQTLDHGAGDMEDRAIVKWQALRALGFSSNDLWLTLARDAVGGPVTVLTARVGGRYFILDDTGGAPFLADTRRREFQPVLSFGWSGTWVHTRGTGGIAARTASASSTGK